MQPSGGLSWRSHEISREARGYTKKKLSLKFSRFNQRRAPNNANATSATATDSEQRSNVRFEIDAKHRNDYDYYYDFILNARWLI